jgi:carbamoyl-phosphate synthase large subunit
MKVIRTAAGCLSSMALINEMKKNNVSVIATDCNPCSIGLHLCDKGYVVPKGDDPKFIKEIIKICENEKPNAIISGPEEEVINFSREKDLFDELGILLLCPNYESVGICMDKVKTNNALSKLNIPVPEIYNESEIVFPCIIKPRSGRGGRGIYKIENEDDFNFFKTKVDNLMIQEFVDGEEYTIDTFADRDGTPLSVIPRLRLLTESGISVKGMTVNDLKIIEYCKKIVKELRLFGPSCIQCIKDKQGDVKFLEINPRFGGGSVLSIKSDPTIMQNLIKIIKGEKPMPSKGFKEGLVMIRYYSELFLNNEEIKIVGNGNECHNF